MSLEDIARIAGVSKSTVSRVINNDVHVRDTTRTKVQAVIDAQGYSPNLNARALVTNRTQTIAVVISNNISTFFDTSHYFPSILRGISEASIQRDYAMLLMLGKDNEDDVRFTRRIIRNQMLDGVILVSPAIGHPIIQEMLDTKTIFVSADKIDIDDDNVNYVTVENINSTRTAISHLIKLGRRRILMIAGDIDIADTHDRIHGYKLALEEAGIPFDPELLVIDKYNTRAGYDAISRLLDADIEFDGVFASQENIAVGAMNALSDRGIHIPQDVSLVAFDDLVEGNETQIGISTMRQPVVEKGRQLCHTLIDLIEGKVSAPIRKSLATELIIRESCGGKENQLTNY
jgi:LacI family transcriptional regulator